MKHITKTIVTISLILPISSFAQSTLDYTTSVKVNGIELNQAVPATLVEKLIGKSNSKISKVHSECTGNYEYSTQSTTGKNLKSEIFHQDNPQIKSDSFYKTKNNYQQLGTTKGQVWLSWANAQTMTDTILINNKLVNSQYTLSQFKKDFPNSAKTGTNVLMLNASEAKLYLMKPADFEVGYTAYISFDFKNGKLNKLDINQAIAC